MRLDLKFNLNSVQHSCLLFFSLIKPSLNDMTNNGTQTFTDLDYKFGIPSSPLK